MSAVVPAALAAAACLALAFAASGCQSTQAKSKELSKSADTAVAGQKGLKISRKSRSVKVTDTAVLADGNGAAAVAIVKNTSGRALERVPLAIDVTAGRKSLFTNDDPGLEPSLTGIASLAPGQTIAWVNDQVFTEGKATGVKVTAGAEQGAVKGDLPKITVGKATLGGDPTSGIAAEGSVANESGTLQKKLVLFAVARRGGRIVAAGRGQVEKLQPRKKAKYQIFFIGNPKGAEITVAAPATGLG